MSLVRAFPECRAKLYSSVYDIIKNRFILPEAFHELCAGYTLTGGSLLELLLGENYNCTDWDYCINEIPPWRDLPLVLNPGQVTYWKYLDIRIYRCLGSYPHSRIIKNVYNCIESPKQKVVQVIHLKKSIERYVADFDLDFCKNYLSEDKLVVKNPISVLHKICKIDLFDAYFYKTRSLKHIRDTVLPKKYERLEKYVKRGFEIDIAQLDSFEQLFEKSVSTYELPVSKVRAICLCWSNFWQKRIDSRNRLILDQISESERDERTFKKKFN